MAFVTFHFMQVLQCDVAISTSHLLFIFNILTNLFVKWKKKSHLTSNYFRMNEINSSHIYLFENMSKYRVRRENLYTQIINIILSCINATKTCNTAIERQLCELFKSVRFLKLTLLLKYTGRFKWDQSDLTYAHLKSNLKFRGSLRLYGLKSVILC